MPFHRTDVGKIEYPKGISAQERRFCRRIYSAINAPMWRGTPDDNYPDVIVACSGGLDSTVLAHAFAMAKIISPDVYDRPVLKRLAYVNHNLRPQEEIDRDIAHVKKLGQALGYSTTDIIDVQVPKGNVQAEAREVRYDSLVTLARAWGSNTVLLGHHANDVAETKLWQFITGRYVDGISPISVRPLEEGSSGVYFQRPLIEFTREELYDYAKIWQLDWVEDSSNASRKYARNRIRQELIPWIENEINPGVVKMLAK
jgi:tRNA(Ile)-lysidine synthase